MLRFLKVVQEVVTLNSGNFLHIKKKLLIFNVFIDDFKLLSMRLNTAKKNNMNFARTKETTLQTSLTERKGTFHGCDMKGTCHYWLTAYIIKKHCAINA